MTTVVKFDTHTHVCVLTCMYTNFYLFYFRILRVFPTRGRETALFKILMIQKKNGTRFTRNFYVGRVDRVRTVSEGLRTYEFQDI